MLGFVEDSKASAQVTLTSAEEGKFEIRQHRPLAACEKKCVQEGENAGVWKMREHGAW